MTWLGDLIAALNRHEFTHLGRVFLWPGEFVHLAPARYLGLMAAGAVWILAAAVISRRLVRRFGVGAAAGVFFLMSGLYVTLAYPPTTDEPHYLIIAESLVEDGDIGLARNYSGYDYRKFFPVPEIDPHTVITRDGEMYSQHTIGLPIVILPGYAIAGRWGVTAILAFVAAALIAVLARLCVAAGVSRQAATVTVGALAATAPLLLSSTLVFTEVTAALLVGVALLNLRNTITVAGCAAFLPWLHPRYGVISIGLAVLCIRAAGLPRLGTVLAVWTGAALISAGLFFGAVYRGDALVAVLNTITEKYPAHIGDLTAANLSVQSFGNPVVAFLGKLFDRDFGIVPYAPWVLVMIPALALPRLRGKARAELFWIGAAAYLGLTLIFRNWGGSAFPGRTLVPLLPFAAPYLAIGVEWSLASGLRRRVLQVLGAVSIGTAWILTACPVLRYESGRDWLAAKTGVFRMAFPFNWFPSFEAGTESLLGVRAILIPAGIAVVVVLIRRGAGVRR